MPKVIHEISKNVKNALYIIYSHEKYIKKSHLLSSSAFFAGTLLCLFTFMALMPTDPSGQIAEAATGTATASTTSLTLTTGSDTAKLNLTINNANGTFSSSSETEKAKFTVTTTNYTGYTLIILAKDNSGKLLNNEEYLESISSAISSSTFDNADYNGKWGYMPSKLNSADNENFLPAPTSETTLNVTNCANNTAGSDCASASDEYTITLGARADYTKPSGTYSNTFILTATANKINYSVTYVDNSGIATTMPSPNPQSGDTDATSITLSNTVPVREGYEFKGWCTVNTSNETCSDTTYQPGETYPINQTTINATTLYAIWAPSSYDITVDFAGSGISSVTFSASGYTTRTVSASGGTASLAYGVTYTMTANFSSGYEFISWTADYGTLDSTSANPTTYEARAGTATIAVTGKSSCTNTISGTMQAFNPCSDITATSGSLTDSRDNQVCTVAKINGYWWMTRNLAIGCNGSGSTYGSSVSSKSLMPTNSNVSSDYSTPTALLSAASASTRTADLSTGRIQCNAVYGAWYNYYTATAGTVSGFSTVDTGYDLCPKGWRLPTYSQFSTIGTSDGSTTYVSAFSPVYSGYYLSGTLHDADSMSGYWWSSTADKMDRYRLNYFIDRLVLSETSYSRYYGFSVRCIYKP